MASLYYVAIVVVRSLHHDLVDDHACSWSLNPFGPHHPHRLVDFRQDGKRAVSREAGSETFWSA